jgi:hypothetical protein
MVLLTVFYGTLAGIYVWRARARRHIVLPPSDPRTDAEPPPAAPA